MELLLIPTAFERDLGAELLDQRLDLARFGVEVCGFGPIQSAIHTTRWINIHRPTRVWLVGLAGAYHAPSTYQLDRPASATLPERSELSPDLVIGQSYEFTRVAIHGIGVGEGSNHVSFDKLGWSQRFGDSPAPQPVIDWPENAIGRTLLTVCSASANQEEAHRRRSEFPNAWAEDMESYSVAAACQSMNVPLRILRGISNIAGDRHHPNWKSKQAMTAALELFHKLNP